jgi:hypothetical protein
VRRILLLTALFAAACAPARGDVEVDWTFGGKACDAAGVATIQVDIAGEVLTPNQFTCAQASLGADLGTYLVGNYSITISGFDANNTTVYQTTQTLQVRGGGKQTFTIDVPPTTGQVTLHWTFGGKSCAAAGITVVHASVDNQVLLGSDNSADLPCSQGGIDGTTVGPLSAGTHSFDLVGVDSTGTARYALNGYGVPVVAGQNVVVAPDLTPAAPTTASANLTWSFASGTSSGKSCAVAGVTQVQIFIDPNPVDGTGGTQVGPAGSTVACDTAGTDGASVDGISPGYHTFAIYGINNNVLLYRTHHPPSNPMPYFVVGLITNVTVSAESPP